MITEKPKPCPFCGETPVLVPKDPKIEGDAWGAVQCASQKCPSYDDLLGYGVRIYDGQGMHGIQGSDAFIDCAIRRWNQRAN